MNKALKISLVGLAIGSLTYLIFRFAFRVQASGDRFVMLTMAIYLLLGWILTWRRKGYVPKQDTDETEEETKDLETIQEELKKDIEKRPISLYGYSFFLAVALIMALDFFLR